VLHRLTVYPVSPVRTETFTKLKFITPVVSAKEGTARAATSNKTSNVLFIISLLNR